MYLKQVLFFLFISSMLSCFVYYKIKTKQDFFQFKFNKKPNVQHILYWSPFWRETTYYGWGLGFKPFKHCQFKNCFTTTDRKMIPLEQFAALLFHATYNVEKYGIPRVRSKHQRYIFVNTEAPVHLYPDLPLLNSFYNWTMSYRHDSDIITRHGSIFKHQRFYQLPSMEYIKAKNQSVAWFVSNCKTANMREHLAEALSKHIRVDVYGMCGNYTCAKRNNTWSSTAQCYSKIESKYKFYLSFENSYCKDYVTEKLWNILLRNIVPVVYGDVNYKTIAPPHSVINVEDFDTVEDLAEYLRYLETHPEEYVKYFEWKKDYLIMIGSRSACQLCKKLNDPWEQPSIYTDLKGWWWGVNNSICKVDKQLPPIVSSLNV